MNQFSILIEPVITEKSTLLQESGQYVFYVHLEANKTQVKEAVERIFKVKVRKVNIMKRRGQRQRFGPRLVKQPDKKRAVVSLIKGDKIPLFEGA